MNNILVYFSIKYDGNWDKIYKALEEKEKVSLEEITKIEEKIKEKNWIIKTIIDNDYPNSLKHSYKPPFVLWITGNLNLIKKNFICVTGNQCDRNSLQRIKKFIPEINKEYFLVTGSYKGLDENILENTKKGVMYILANGINSPWYNYEPKKEDILITEYPPNSKLSKEKLRNRNRLISSFGKSLILITSKKDGPINNLITNFLNLGKEVYCFPGEGTKEDGNSELIKQGAKLITNIEDVSN